jgi:predicted nucleotidyltransferase
MKNNNIIGIVAEYNPFHKGHAYQITAAKKLIGDSTILAVMSGSFVQRGEPALTDKWSRAKMAIAGGVDLVIELPAIYACRSGQAFAQGAVGTLQATGCITHLVFGCETKTPELLQAMGQVKINLKELQAYMKLGVTYAAAMEILLNNKFPNYEKIIKSPNNILALEYYRALNTLNSSIIPLPIQRHGAGYLDKNITTLFPGASAIREYILANGVTNKLMDALPYEVFEQLRTLQEKQLLGINNNTLTSILNYTLAKSEAATIAEHCDTSEGLENKLADNCNCTDFADLVNKIKSKRYPATRIQRLLCQLLISTPQVPFAATSNIAPSYLRILAFNDRGRKLLKIMKASATLPILTKLGKNIFAKYPDADFHNTLKTEITATNVYDILQGNGNYNRDYTTSTIYVSSQPKLLK